MERAWHPEPWHLCFQARVPQQPPPESLTHETTLQVSTSCCFPPGLLETFILTHVSRAFWKGGFSDSESPATGTLEFVRDLFFVELLWRQPSGWHFRSEQMPA